MILKPADDMTIMHSDNIIQSQKFYAENIIKNNIVKIKTVQKPLRTIWISIISWLNIGADF